MAAFTNQAVLTYNGTAVNSNLVSGEIVSPISLTKTPGAASYAAGDSLTYLISLVNDGSVSYENLTLTDDLGAVTLGAGTAYPLAYVADSVRYFINGALQAAPAVTPGGPLVISGLSVPAGGNALVVYEARVTPAAPLAAGGSITNTATLTGTGLSAPLEAQATVPVAEQPELSILKSLSPTAVEPRGQLTYTFLIQNRGNRAAEAEAAVAVTDLFDPILSNLAVNLGGRPMTPGTDYAYDQASGQFNTVPGRITVPAATYAQTTATGDWVVIPGEVTLTVTGTV